ncbi:1-acyl-sn-glycerol-3-phosphate acyltransferase [Roseivirga sp. BDSF3-8]|uniref:1-acyl-sn-glycerol-3-phosphate acyltransferase n=1 Tax=Roseivirga sp. BDSF3-8 TaxID=3241598 RepID=UPI0035323EDF
MVRALAKFLFFVSGWRLGGKFPADVKKAVMVAAPHTSNWDLVYARAAFYLMGIPVRFTIKKEWIKGPMGWFLKKLGAIAIDRQKFKSADKRGSSVAAMIELFDSREELVVLVTPEGTRKYAEKWKTGFYYVALGAKLPIVLGYLNYKEKVAGIGPAIQPTGDIEIDMEKIKDFYRKIPAKYPDQGVK